MKHCVRYVGTRCRNFCTRRSRYTLIFVVSSIRRSLFCSNRYFSISFSFDFKSLSIVEFRSFSAAAVCEAFVILCQSRVTLADAFLVFEFNSARSLCVLDTKLNVLEFVLSSFVW